MRPWEVGDHHQRWNGYLDLGHVDPLTGAPILRNLVGATTGDELRQREDTFVGVRALTLRANGIPGSYDLAGLQAIHRHLFQDVYEWAGELRTVGMQKGASAFLAPDEIEPVFVRLAEVIAERDNLRDVQDRDFPKALAVVYGAVNGVHPFREGNGRTQREFVTALARESGRSLDWTLVRGPVNDMASEAARNGDRSGLQHMFEQIVTPAPAPAVQLPTPPRIGPVVGPGRSSQIGYGR